MGPVAKDNLPEKVMAGDLEVSTSEGDLEGHTNIVDHTLNQAVALF
jgi:hypothetical protein